MRRPPPPLTVAPLRAITPEIVTDPGEIAAIEKLRKRLRKKRNKKRPAR